MDYTTLFTPNHQQKPNFMALAAAVLSQAEDLFALLDSLPTAWSLDTAVGAQLDTLGALSGLPRPESAASDADYRLYLRARIAAFHWDGTQASLPETLSRAFPDREATMTDNLNGSVTASLSGDAPPFGLKELFPVPAGVRLIENR